MHKIITSNKTPVLSTGVLFFLSLSTSAQAQNAVIQNDLSHKVNLYNVNGRPWVNSGSDIAGNPFFLAAWKYGIIEISDDKVFAGLQLRLNLQNQQVHFKGSDNKELVIDAGAVMQIILLDTPQKNLPVSYVFQCGFPPIDNQSEKNFYLLLCNGKIRFLRSLRKTIYEDKDIISAEVKKEYRLNDDYYFFIDDKMQRIKKDKNFILEFMKDTEGKIDKYVTQNKLSYKSIDDIKKIVDYYNSL